MGITFHAMNARNPRTKHCYLLLTLPLLRAVHVYLLITITFECKKMQTINRRWIIGMFWPAGCAVRTTSELVSLWNVSSVIVLSAGSAGIHRAEGYRLYLTSSIKLTFGNLLYIPIWWERSSDSVQIRISEWKRLIIDDIPISATSWLSGAECVYYGDR